MPKSLTTEPRRTTNAARLSLAGVVTPLILTFNEERNIGRVLNRLKWAKQVLVLDSFSTDKTRSIAESFSNVVFVQRKFDTFAQQCNFGLTQVHSPWVLSLDSDYILSKDFIREVQALEYPSDCAGYIVPIHYCVREIPLRGCLYPPRTVLYRKDLAHYIDKGHGHQVQIQGEVRKLKSIIFHDDHKPLERFLEGQIRYLRIEAEALENTPSNQLNFADRVRRCIVVAPILVPLYSLFFKGLILDGWAGWHYTFQRTVAECILSLYLIDAKIKKWTTDHGTTDY